MYFRAKPARTAGRPSILDSLWKAASGSVRGGPSEETVFRNPAWDCELRHFGDCVISVGKLSQLGIVQVNRYTTSNRLHYCFEQKIVNMNRVYTAFCYPLWKSISTNFDIKIEIRLLEDFKTGTGLTALTAGASGCSGFRSHNGHYSRSHLTRMNIYWNFRHLHRQKIYTYMTD